MNNKDVIYIDIDDDITAIVGKIKSASHEIVALVPPKRNNTLQSVVNLKLLQRKAKSVSKRIVLVTSDHTVTALAGSLGLYVAKNLQTKPEIPTVSAVLDEPAAIDDEPIEVPEQVSATADKIDTSEVTEDDLKSLDPSEKLDFKINDNTKPKSKSKSGAKQSDSTGDEPLDSKPLDGDKSGKVPKASKKSKKPKVPNFSKFRKRVLIIIGVLLLLVAVAVIYPLMTGKTVVTIHGETSSEALNFQLKADANAASTSPEDGVIKATAQQLQKTVSQPFEATGEKNIGQKASGSIQLTATKCGGNPFDIPEPVPGGTTISASGVSFTIPSTVSFSGTGESNGCYNYSGNSSITVDAPKPGEKYNVKSDKFAVSGRSDVAGSGTVSGGTDKIVHIITQDDVDKAVAAAKGKQDDGAKQQLTGQFDKDMRILSDSFTQSAGEPSVTPNVGDQASKGTVTIQYTYTGLAVSNDDVNAVLDKVLSKNIENKETQRIYKNGYESIDKGMSLVGEPTSSSATYQVSVTGYIGPKFDQNKIKQEITGEKYGVIVSMIQDSPGVSSVEIDFSPSWGRFIPFLERKAGSPDRITINLDVSQTDDDS